MTFTNPLRFAPWLRPMPWGGTALAKLFHLPQSPSPIGEAWLLSDHELHQSRVADGPWQGRTLRELLENHSQELLGHPRDRFPLLIKILDAQENLSVQVHPDDESAARWAPAEGGKTEAWTVLDSAPDAAIYLGLKRGIDKTALARELAIGNLVPCLQRFSPRPLETYFVPAGTVHALGQGVLALEVQQSSDATFRLYDWGRVGADGKPRQLHLEAGLACTRDIVPQAGLQTFRPQADGTKLLVRSEFFAIHRLPVDQSLHRKAPALLFPWEGSLTIQDESIPPRALIFLPASLGETEVSTGPQSIVFEIRWS